MDILLKPKVWAGYSSTRNIPNEPKLVKFWLILVKKWSFFDPKTWSRFWTHFWALFWAPKWLLSALGPQKPCFWGSRDPKMPIEMAFLALWDPKILKIDPQEGRSYIFKKTWKCIQLFTYLENTSNTSVFDPKMGSKWPQNGRFWGQKWPKMAILGSKWPLRGQKWPIFDLFLGLKMAKIGHFWSILGSKWPQNDHFWRKWPPKMS